MPIVLSRSMMVFALLISFSVHGDGCRSWWSELDGVHHCLLSGNGEDNDTQIPAAAKETKDIQTKPEEPNTDDISAPNNPQQLPPDFQITDVSEIE
jgi:hypothetical protein